MPTWPSLRRHRKITKNQVARTIENLGDMAKALRDGSAERKSDVYASMGLHAEYDPETKKVRVEVNLDPAPSRSRTV